MSDTDPKIVLEKKCHPNCAKKWAEYEACGKRIEGDTEGKNCQGYYFEYWKCIDKCATPHVFKYTK